MSIEIFIDKMECPDCEHSALLLESEKLISCTTCMRSFRCEEHGIWEMMPEESPPMPAVYEDSDYLKWQTLTSEAENSMGLLQRIFESSPHKRIVKMKTCEAQKWVLDAGCGTGAHYPFFSDLSSVIGLDADLESLILTRKKYPNALLIHGSIYSLPFKNNVIPGCISVYVLEHLWFLENAVDEILRVLNDEGTFWVGLPCEGGWFYDTLRKHTTEKTNTQKYNIDYKKVARIEHCNTVEKILSLLESKCNVVFKSFFPLPIRKTDLNLSVALELTKK